MLPSLEIDQHSFAAVADHLNDRIAQLQLTQTEVAERAGLSVQVVRDLQRGRMRNYHPRTLARIADAVDWPPVAVACMLAELPTTSWASSDHC